MNYVLLAVIAALGYLLAAVLAFVLASQGRDREAVEAKLRTERDDALLRNVKLADDNTFLLAELVEIRTENANYEVRIVELLSQIGTLEDALSALRAKRTTKKAVNE